MSDSNDPEIMTIDQAAKFLGVSVKTFNKVLHGENIPGRKIGREWKFSRSALIEWIGGGRSDQFYREDEEDEILPQPAPEAGSVNGSPAKPTEARRRTAGWRLEYD